MAMLALLVVEGLHGALQTVAEGREIPQRLLLPRETTEVPQELTGVLGEVTVVVEVLAL
jgi:hypothetical protein